MKRYESIFYASVCFALGIPAALSILYLPLAAYQEMGAMIVSVMLLPTGVLLTKSAYKTLSKCPNRVL